jgi:exodeoxyribonuclease V alpha subunit
LNKNDPSKNKDNEQHELKGILERFIYQSPDASFSVAKIIIDTNSPAIGISINANTMITICGNLIGITPGQTIIVKGTWTEHKKFGRQLTVSSAVGLLPTTTTGLVAYLSSGLIKGIGPSYAQRLVDFFGTKLLDIFEHEPDRLYAVPGIGEQRVNMIITAWKEQKDIAQLLIFLQDRGISTTYALKIYKHYHNHALAILQRDPYRLADDIWGISFKTADQLAQKMGIAKDAPERIRAAIIFVISSATQQGDLYITPEQLQKKLSLLLELTDFETLMHTTLQELITDKKIININHHDKELLALTNNYYAEYNTAIKLSQLINTPSPLSLILEQVLTIVTSTSSTSTTTSITLHEQQINGIKNALTNTVSIITGGPGTGKTTLIKTLITILETHGISYQLAAPTGRAAKRISESTQRNASTIHRLLEFDTTTMQFIHNETKLLKTSFIIIDEASMIDIFLASAVLRAIRPGTHLLIIGDRDQLPSVGPGSFLADMIDSATVPVTTLTELFRQSADSLITYNAHRIREGIFPVTNNSVSSDFIFIKEDKPEEFINHIKRLIPFLRKYHNITPEQVMILVPMNRASAGTITLNAHLQEFFNPNQTLKITTPHGFFALHDRVMQLRNNYEKLIFNGDIGTIQNIDTQAQEITILFGERTVLYQTDELNELVLAYATTIHKSQGSEYPAIILGLFCQHFTLLARNLVYTALTRASRICMLVGEPKALAIALKTTKYNERMTLLAHLLQQNHTNIEGTV